MKAMSRSGSFLAPPGFRDSPERALGQGEVIASTYSVRDELVRTDTGVVYEARDMAMDRPVALKLVWRDPGTPSLIAEARRCAAVRDPCAVAIYGVGNHHGVEFVVGERVTGRLLRDALGARPSAADHLQRWRALVAAVVRAHAAGIAVGDISASTVLACDADRLVLGRLSLSQAPAFGPLGQVFAPEVVRGEVQPTDPNAAAAIDLYGLGCAALELATGKRPFAGPDPAAELRAHATAAPPRLIQLRPDLPAELSDLVDWLIDKRPSARPRSAQEVLRQIDALIDRLGGAGRAVRVLVVDDDLGRARWLWSLARRAHPTALVELASEGNDAAHKLVRDMPDLVLVSARLRGVMNAYELCMYARGLETEHRAQLVLIGDTSERDRALFTSAQVACLPDDTRLPGLVIDHVRAAAAEPPRRRRTRTTVSG